MTRYFFFFWVCCVSYFTGFSQQTYPQLNKICTDQANIMSYEQLLNLRQKLTDFETETSHQIAVLTINNLGNESIENYALEVFDQNRIGQIDVDNGLLILFSADDREVRIEVGYGLEPIITDAISSRLIRNIMVPEFKKERYFEGIDLATDEIIKIISDPEYIIEFSYEDDNSQMMPWWGKVIVVLFVGGFLSVFFLIGFYLLKKSFKDLVNTYRGLISGEISVISFPFMLFGILFTLMFGLVFTVVPLLFFLMMLSLVVFNLNVESMMNNIFSSGYLNGTNIFLAIGFLLVGLPMLIAILIVKRYKEGFKFSYLKTNKSYVKKNISFSSSTSSSRSSSYSRSSGSSRSSSSSSRSSFSGGGGRSGGGGASGRW